MGPEFRIFESFQAIIAHHLCYFGRLLRQMRHSPGLIFALMDGTTQEVGIYSKGEPPELGRGECQWSGYRRV